MKQRLLKHEFVEFIPEVMEAGIVYVSVQYTIAVHKCCCGCGNDVVTPLSPTDWRLIYDGKTVSLEPSIGNWGFACQSHYWITRNRVRWAEKWTSERIQGAREFQKEEAAAFYKNEASDAQPGKQSDAPKKQNTWWSKVKGKFPRRSKKRRVGE